MEKKITKKQTSQYDKIFKENIEAVIPSLMLNVLGISAIAIEELPDDIQHTKERKPDVLKKITDNQANTFVLQIEFQVADEQEMVYRMAEYNVMLARKYKLPIRQYVIFLGKDEPKMPQILQNTHLRYEFTLIRLSELDYHIFLNSNNPEEIILSVLANFQQENEEDILKQIISRIDENTESDLSLKRYFNQLRILAQLRNLDIKFENAMESIAKYINEERDVLYLRGQKKAEERFVKNLLDKMTFTLEQIADIAGVSVEFVKNVKNKR